MKKIMYPLMVVLALSITNGCNKNPTDTPNTDELTVPADASQSLASGVGANALVSGVYVRKNVYSLTSSEITLLRNGINVMKSRSSTDPTSWAFQSAIHGSMSTNLKPGMNTCQHGSFFFLSWHRMFLYYFERILRKASGSSTFSLPYWNYSDVSSQAALPASFRSPKNSSNPLYVSQRDAAINAGGYLPASVVSYKAAFAKTAFATTNVSDPGFGGLIVSGPVHFNNPHSAIENQPHDVVHVTIGGWMSDPFTAAQDPIFWLHHANIDRLWDKWLRQGSSRANPTGNSAWMNTSFTFYDENGKAVSMKGSQIVDMVSQLNYRYDDMPASLATTLAQMVPEAQVQPRTRQQTEFLKINNVDTKGERTELSLGKTTTNRLNDAVSSVARSSTLSTDGQQIVLLLSGITYNKAPRGTFEVYINQPKGVEPEFDSPYYAGNIGLFGFMMSHGGMSMGDGGSVSLDITNTIRNLAAKNVDLSQINVTIFHRGIIMPDQGKKNANFSGEIKIKSVSVLGLQ